MKKDVRSESEQETARLKKKVEEILPKIAPLRGALCKQVKRCGRSNCKCAKGELHGPYYYHFSYFGPKLRKKYVKKSEIPAVLASILAYKQAERARRNEILEGKRQWREAMASLREYHQYTKNYYLREYRGGRS